MWKLEVVLSADASALDAWKAIEIRGRRLGPETVEDVQRFKEVEISPATAHFDFAVGGLRITFGCVAHYSHCLFKIEGIADVASARGWIGALHQVGLRIVSARLYDGQYERWQNAEDPLEYEAAGRSHAALRKTSNGLPPPLGKQIIDTSRNPGRRVLRNGFVEAVGSTMWLGEAFWKYVSLHADNLSETELKIGEGPGGTVEVQAWPEPFKRDEGPEGDVQRRLRRVLFQSDGAGRG